MITEPTVFILGAGASEPYGLPLGHGLKDDIFRLLNPGANNETRRRIVVDIAGKHVDMGQLGAFLTVLGESAEESIDDFLLYRPEFTPIAKAAIAAIILSKENKQTLRRPKGKKRTDTEKDFNWYRYLVLNMLAAPLNLFSRNKVSFLTFNYDRSLEEYLCWALQSRNTANTTDDWGSVLRKLPIIHLHGMVGLHPVFGNTDDPIVPYGPDDTNPEEIRVAAHGIRIIHEDIKMEMDQAFLDAYQLLENAKCVCFLGFGYHKTNLERLALESLKGKTKLLGSAYGFTDAEKTRIPRQTHGALEIERIGGPDQDCLQFIRESKDLQSVYD